MCASLSSATSAMVVSFVAGVVDARLSFESPTTRRYWPCARLSQIIELLGEDSWRNVYAGELEVRHQVCPPFGPATVRRAPLRPTALDDSANSWLVRHHAWYAQARSGDPESAWRLHAGSRRSDHCYSHRSATSGSILAARRA